MQNLQTRVHSQIDLGHDHYVLRLHALSVARAARAGQFVMLGLPDLHDMLIRRPFSIARIAPEEPGGPPVYVDILYKVFGRGTQAFSMLRTGDTMALLGPLGRGFQLPEPREGEQFVLVAGGIGNAIFPLLLQELGERARHATLVFGAATASELTLVDWFEQRCGRVVLATDDGTAGHHGLVTGPLVAELDALPAGARPLVCACGPTPMLRAVRTICLERDLPGQLALEAAMACGFGVCLGCVVEKAHPDGEFDRFVRVCQEGPVFEAREVVL